MTESNTNEKKCTILLYLRIINESVRQSSRFSFHLIEMLLFVHEDAVENNTNRIQKEEKEASRIKE